MKPQARQGMCLFKLKKKSLIWAYGALACAIWGSIWVLGWYEAPDLDPDFRAEDIPVFAPPVVARAPKKYFTLEPLD